MVSYRLLHLSSPSSLGNGNFPILFCTILLITAVATGPTITLEEIHTHPDSGRMLVGSRVGLRGEGRRGWLGSIRFISSHEVGKPPIRSRRVAGQKLFFLVRMPRYERCPWQRRRCIGILDDPSTVVQKGCFVSV